MKNGSNSRMKRHIISMRISSEELDYLHEIMKGQQFKRVSDVMRAVFKLALTLPTPLGDTASEGQQRIG